MPSKEEVKIEMSEGVESAQASIRFVDDEELGETPNGRSNEIREMLEAFLGHWKIVWVVTAESMNQFLLEKQLSPAFRRIARSIHGNEFSFSVTDDGCWVETELSEKAMFRGTSTVPCPVNGLAIDCIAPGGEEVSKRVVFEDGKLLIVEASKGHREGEVVQHDLHLIDDNTLHRTLTNTSTGTRFVIVYARTSIANHHRSLMLHREIATGEPVQHRGRMAFLPAMLFMPLWLYAMAKNQIWRAVFGEFWPMSVAMVFGSFIAGSTPLGGGVVGFPVAVLALRFNAVQGRDFSAMIQSVGMTSASWLIAYLKPQLVDPTLVSFSIVFGVLGCIVGFIVRIDSFAINLFLTTYLVAFAIVYCYKNEVIESYAIPVPPTLSERKSSAFFDFRRHHQHDVKHRDLMPVDAKPSKQQKNVASAAAKNRRPSGGSGSPLSSEGTTLMSEDDDDDAARDPRATTRYVALAITSLIGGFVTAKLGSGTDSMAYIFASCVWNPMVQPKHRISESKMTASTVIAMATMSIVVVGLRLTTGRIEPDVIRCWAAAAPVVCLGAPIGSLILGPAAEIMLRRFFYFIAFLQFFFFALIVIKTHAVGWSIVATAIVLSFGAIVAHYHLRLKPRIRSQGVILSSVEA